MVQGLRESGSAVHVSGAGPAGLAAAISIARAGGCAVVHERRADVGLRFHGDLQGLENWTTPGNVLEELGALGLSGFDARPCHEVVCFGPGGFEYRARSEEPIFYLVRRGPAADTLDQALKRRALEHGAELRFGDTVRALPQGGIVAHGPHRADAVAVGYVFDTDMVDGAYGALSTDLAPGGYAYCLVSAGRGTVATCMFSDFRSSADRLAATVDFFERRAGLRMRAPIRFGGFGNFLAPLRPVHRGVCFAGETAGFQDALWGFGIRYALLSGHLAGHAWVSGDPASYDALWRRRLGGILRRGIVNRRVFGMFGDRGLRALLHWLVLARSPRRWLHDLYAPTLWSDLAYPWAGRRFRPSDAVRRADAAEPEAAAP